MIVVNAVIETTAENIANMTDAIAEMETASRLEAGCHDYTFSVEINNPKSSESLRSGNQWRL